MLLGADLGPLSRACRGHRPEPPELPPGCAAVAGCSAALGGVLPDHVQVPREGVPAPPRLGGAVGGSLLRAGHQERRGHHPRYRRLEPPLRHRARGRQQDHGRRAQAHAGPHAPASGVPRRDCLLLAPHDALPLHLGRRRRHPVRGRAAQHPRRQPRLRAAVAPHRAARRRGPGRLGDVLCGRAGGRGAHGRRARRRRRAVRRRGVAGPHAGSWRGAVVRDGPRG
mmetsp:Transcript_39315/g.76963  ORF Transcript_39315/g.76963 Transcript_39315/m.76963 type:complete len:225 (+) Transcript_39315:750-1424(+)